MLLPQWGFTLPRRLYLLSIPRMQTCWLCKPDECLLREENNEWRKTRERVNVLYCSIKYWIKHTDQNIDFSRKRELPFHQFHESLITFVEQINVIPCTTPTLFFGHARIQSAFTVVPRMSWELCIVLKTTLLTAVNFREKGALLIPCNPRSNRYPSDHLRTDFHLRAFGNYFKKIPVRRPP